MEIKDVVESVFRWLHVVAGIVWIGMLYFFNFVNSAFAPTMDGDTKKKVVPQLMPRALYWFRWGAAWTWVSGIILLALVFYHAKNVFPQGKENWSAEVVAGIAVTFLGVLLYDNLFRMWKDQRVSFAIGWILASAAAIGFAEVCHYSFRGSAIHLGAMFGTIMAFNVWMRIWPAQRKIITAVKEGQAPDAALASMAGARSKHNTYMSVPLVMAMLNSHWTWASGYEMYAFPGVILAGWLAVFLMYKIAPKVAGF